VPVQSAKNRYNFNDGGHRQDGESSEASRGGAGATGGGRAAEGRRTKTKEDGGNKKRHRAKSGVNAAGPFSDDSSKEKELTTCIKKKMQIR